MILPQPIAALGTGIATDEKGMLRLLGPDCVFMMGDNPELPRMPKAPKLLDFFKLRFSEIAFSHLLQSAKMALDAAQDEKIVIACLLHDISNGALLRTDHGYWSAQRVTSRTSRSASGIRTRTINFSVRIISRLITFARRMRKPVPTVGI
jgi:HD superfamily phosphodiesterase